MKLLLTALLLLLVSANAYGMAAIRSFAVVPVITADAYAQGDQIGTYTKLSGIATGSGIDLRTLVVIDHAKVKHDLQLLFFNSAPTLASADNAAVSFTDAVAASSFIGRYALAEADYVDTASNSQATKALEMLLATKGSQDLYVVIVCVDSGGCDYGAVGDLVLRLTYFE
jgi:hypothetical protein